MKHNKKNWPAERAALEAQREEDKLRDPKVWNQGIFIWDNNFLAFRWYYDITISRLIAEHRGKYFGTWTAGYPDVIEIVKKIEEPEYRRIRKTHDLNMGKDGHHIAHEFCDYCEPNVDFKEHDYFKLKELIKKWQDS